MIERTEFPTIQAFYLERGGARSGESDYGVMWRSPERGGYYRVTVVHDTGDVYAERLGYGESKVVVLGTLPHDCGRRDLATIQTHGDRCAYAVGERTLAGWADALAGGVRSDDSLVWVRERLVDYPPTGAGRREISSRRTSWSRAG